MPTYSYQCSHCNHSLEVLQSIKAEPLTNCPVCSKEELQRGVGGGIGLAFKGSGFYCTDYSSHGKETIKPLASNQEPKSTSCCPCGKNSQNCS